MGYVSRALVAVGLGLGLLPSSAWAGNCAADSPLLSTAGSHEIRQGSLGLYSYVVAARDKTPYCSGDELSITAAGLPPGTFSEKASLAPGEAALIVFLDSKASSGTYNVTYMVTDSINNTTSVSLPVRIQPSTIYYINTTPALDPVSDLIVGVGQTVSFTIGITDPDKDLEYSQQTLVIDGLPLNAKKEWTQLTPERLACRITLTPQSYERGTYRVHIRGRDKRGGVVIAQMRLVITY